MGSKPTTPTGKRLADGYSLTSDPSEGIGYLTLADILAIEDEARQQEREQLRAKVAVSNGIYVSDVDGWCVTRDRLDDILADPEATDGD